MVVNLQPKTNTFWHMNIETTSNLNIAVVQDNLVESPSQEQQAVVDRIPQLPRILHPAIKAIVEPYPKDRKGVMAFMSLGFLGTLGGGIRAQYRNQEIHHMGFEMCLMDAQSNGKSALTRMQDSLISEIIKEDNETRKKYDEYSDECNSASSDMPKPKDPHLGTRIMMADTTKSQFFQNLKNLNKKRAIIVCPEIDSLKVPNNWSRDGGANERLMFDTEIGGQDTKSTAGTSARVPIAVNLVTSGTPLAVQNHYKNAEDGLVTRVGFCSFPADMDEEAEEKARSEENKRQLVEIQQKLMSVKEEDEVLKIPQLKHQQLNWCREKKIVADASGNQSIDTFRKRAAVIGFRAGCLLYVLDGNTVTKKMLDFALWVSEYTLYYQLKYYGEKMNESIEANAEILHATVITTCRNSWALVTLPSTFSYEQVKVLYETLGKKASGYRTVVGRWIKNGWVTKNSDGTFTKTKAGEKMGEAA